MRPWVVVLAGLPVLAAASAQQNAPTVRTLLTQLQSYARDYEARLPSLSCREHITSQLLQNGVVQRATEVDDLVRVVRKPDADPPFEERRLPLNAAGEAEEGRAMPRLPLVIHDAISGGQHGFVSAPEFLACMASTLDTTGATLRLEMVRNAHPADTVKCSNAGDGLQVTTLVDRATGHVVYTRHSLSEEAAKQDHSSTYAETRYAPVRLGDEDFWLPQRVYAEVGTQWRYTATYSGCKRYTVSSRVVGPAE